MADCWDLEENKSKRPKGYKTGTNDDNSGTETGNVSIEYTLGSFQEVALMGNVMISCPCTEESDDDISESQVYVISIYVDSISGSLIT